MNKKEIFLNLAKNAVKNYLEKGKVITPPTTLPKEILSQKAGVFVSIYKKKNNLKELRGCIGTFLPTSENIAQEIIKNAIAAATSDWRFLPIQKEELKDLVFSVDILSPPTPVKTLSDLNPKKYGIIVQNKEGKIGLLLPDLPGIETPEQQLSIALQKAGIFPEEDFLIYKFETQRYQEA